MRSRLLACFVAVAMLAYLPAWAQGLKADESEPLSPQELDEVYHQAWEAIGENYYPPSALRNWGSWEKRFEGKLKSEDDLDAAVSEMVASLGDRWTRYFALKDTLVKETDKAAGCVDIGLSIGREADGTYQVVYVHSNTAAFKGRLQKGDVLRSVNGKALAGVPLLDAERQLCAALGSDVEIGIARGGMQTTIAMKADAFMEVTSSAKVLPGGILYLLLPRFDNDSVVALEDEVVKALKDAGVDIAGVVFDLRGNPGGDVALTPDVTGLLVGEGLVIRYTYREGRTVHDELVQVLSALPFARQDEPQAVIEAARRLYGKPLVVLVDGSTASSAEVVTAALRETGHAAVVGTVTWGKGVAYNEQTLKNGSGLRITTGQMRAPSGLDWAGIGLVPDLAVADNPGTDADEQLEAAVSLIKQNLSAQAILELHP